MTGHRKLTGGVVATIAALALGAGGAALASTEPPAEPGGSTGTITVTGSGTVEVEPDTAILNVGVQANAPTGAEAMTQLTADSNALTEALVAAGIDAADIQTSGLSLWSMTGDDGVTIAGYQASLNVSVTIRDIDAVGPTIDAAQAAVGEGFTIGGVSFSFSDPESVLQQARADAVANARTIAEQYAVAAGVSLGDLVSIVDGYTSLPVEFARAEAAAADMSVAISPGTLELGVQITVTYAIGGSVTEPQGPTVDEAAAVLVGLDEAAAEAAAAENGWTIRVAIRDGEDLPMTMDYRYDRVNVEVADGEVVGVVSVG
jgi:uncharacterized protein YggE